MDFSEFQQEVTDSRKKTNASRLELKTAKQKAENIGRKETRILRDIPLDEQSNNEELIRIRQQQREINKSASEKKSKYSSILNDEWARLKDYLDFTNPVNNLNQLGDDCPILMFPLRLETRFKKVDTDDGRTDQLWVRIFPDDIAINSFESDLTETEIHNARAYWTSRWKAGKKLDGNRAAWRSLASAHGPGRAYWLISNDNYVPTNIDEEPVINDDELILAIGTDEPLVGLELDEIIKYWKAVWSADKDNDLLNQAWQQLIARVTEERATELVKDYKPSNLNDSPPEGKSRDETQVRVEFVIFKKTDNLETKLHSWSQPPTTSILPERFVFMAFNDEQPEIEPVLSNLVPPELILGPDPAAEEGEDFRLATQEDVDIDPSLTVGDLIYSESMHWMFDFDEAVQKGMGFKIDLTAEQARQGFDRIFVLGVKLASDKVTGQELLEELFKQHQFSRKGMSILRQGTPTNNTEDDSSGYSWKHDSDDSFDHYFLSDFIDEEPAPEPENPEEAAIWFNKSDGMWLADILGIKDSSIASLTNYSSKDISEALAMQKALWPSTMGHFMDSMMNPVFDDDDIETTRTFFTHFVSGRGFIPSIRVGKQPYGILPATRYTNMQWFSGSGNSVANTHSFSMFGRGPNYLDRLYAILMDIDAVWMQQKDKVAYIGKDGDSHQLLLDVIGLHPDSVELYKRYANTVKQIHNMYNMHFYFHEGVYGTIPSSYSDEAWLLERYGYSIPEESPVPDLFNLSFFEDSYLLKGHIIDSVPNSEIDTIQAYASEERNYIKWLIDASKQSHDEFRLQEGFTEGRPPSALLYLLLYHALDLSYIDTSLKLHLNKNIINKTEYKKAYSEPDFIHIEQNNETESRWKYLYKADQRITGDPDILLGEFIAQNINDLEEAAAFRSAISGLKTLEHVPTARLERLLMEHIDTVSYRYDAWVLGFLSLQLSHMRNLPIFDTGGGHRPGDTEEEITSEKDRKGIYIGAYGWLEDLRSEDKNLQPVKLSEELKNIFNKDNDLVEDDKNAGYILAPSQNHAVTAAVLRNGNISNDDLENQDELKVKLSSERVRLAMQIIEGMQAGQSLSALLGYQFERGLHDRTDAEVDQYIFDLRNAFPLVAKKIKDTTPDNDDYDSVSQIEARNVLDGVSLLEYFEETDNKNYPYDLDKPPYDLDLPVGTNNAGKAIKDEIEKLQDTNDAVADLALAESVHQVVLGNYETANATLETYSKGHFPPTPDVIKTPRSGTTLTHRVALHFKTGINHNLSDAGITPRMVAEPAIQDWLNDIMPDTSNIECVASFTKHIDNTVIDLPITMSDIGLSSIDLLYLLTSDSEQAMSGLDDLVVHHIMRTGDAHHGEPVTIKYTRAQTDGKLSVFEVSSLVNSLRALLLKSKYLSPSDVKLSNEAAKEHEQVLEINDTRISDVVAGLSDFVDPGSVDSLAKFVEDIQVLVDADNMADFVSNLDDLTNKISDLFIKVSRFGIPQTGIGFVYQWQQSMFIELNSVVSEFRTRWQNNKSDCELLLGEYEQGLLDGIAEEELYVFLAKADLKISSTSSQHAHGTHNDYFLEIRDVKLVAYTQFLDNQILPIETIHAISPYFQNIQNLEPQLSSFDTTGINIDNNLNQVKIFVQDLAIGAENLLNEINNRINKATDYLNAVSSSGDALQKIELVKNAAKEVFGDDFIVVPEFPLQEAHANEWQNTILNSENSLRYLKDDKLIDFPMDDWLYGISRVRDKMNHFENTIIHTEGFSNSANLIMKPSQFPYRTDDYWLGLEYPESIPDPDNPPENKLFTIDEDKLLFTSIYTASHSFDPLLKQCGLLVDEWTEVIPSRDETLGLAFHYDQPNTEPPQTLLLVTPSEFTGEWQWDDLVGTLHETLNMAKKRAVEPDHIDSTIYSRFLPAILSLTSPLPLTATLNLALNNKVKYAQVINNE